MPHEFIYTTYKLARHYPPDRTVLENISISFYPGAKIGVIGPNGAGKSSLLRIMAGLDDGFVGEARLTPGFSVGYLSQEPELDPTKDVKGNVLDGVREVQTLIDQYNAVMAKWSDPDADYEAVGAEQSALEDKIAAPTHGASSATSTSRWTPCAARPTTPTSRRSPAARSAASPSPGSSSATPTCCSSTSPPTTSTPSRSTGSSGSCRSTRARSSRSPTIATSSTTSPSGSSSSIAGGASRSRATTRPGSSRSSSGWRREEKAGDARQRTLARELEWVRLAPRARQAKGKARLSAYEQLLSEANDAKRSERELEIAIPPGPRLGDQVIEVNGLAKAYGDKVLIEDLTFSLPKAGIVGIIGPNGAGKTTLFRMIVGEEKPDRGSITLGDTVQLAYVDQSRDDLQGDKTVYEEISGGNEFIKVGNRELPARAYVSSFNFKGTDQQKAVGKLSGGERNRVHLAKLLKSGGNVLLLDEPTNDLDVDTLRALEAGLESFPGCAVVISHDRWFLDRIATHVLAFEGDSVVRWFEGNFTEYEEFRHRELGTAADQPHRIRYKKLAS